MNFTLPPSVNALFKNISTRMPANGAGSEESGKGKGRQRAKSKAYLAWLKIASWEFLQFRKEARAVSDVGGPYAIEIRLDVDGRSDIDNRVKAILDFLTDQAVLSDDSQVDALHIYRDRTAAGAEVTVTPGYQRAAPLRKTLHGMDLDRVRADIAAWGAFITPEQVNAALVALGIAENE